MSNKLTYTLLFCALSFGMVGIGWLSSSEFQDVRQDNAIQSRQDRGEIIDDNKDGQHDSTCMCGYCTELDDLN